MRGVLLVPSSSPTLSPTYDGLDVSVTSNITWFHLNHGMVNVESINYPSTEGTPLHLCNFLHPNGRTTEGTALLVQQYDVMVFPWEPNTA